jgi:hypothetical protein
MILPATINGLHGIQLFTNKCGVPVYQVTCISGIGYTLAIPAIITAMLEKIVNVSIHVTVVPEPPPFVNMMHRRCVDGAIGIPVPAYMVDEFGDNVSIVTDASDMRFIHFPAVIIYLLQVPIRTFKKRNIVKIPLGIFMKIVVSQAFLINDRIVMIFLASSRNGNGPKN